ncbi:DinB family protein [Hymenobacter sp. DH14]|uniref:DinB family protein n=1 Tax=Hymenobacter cyanobacteriorum TaxID=2926463 RepID=A0A9X1VFK1_9BACT|nr:DinB family protein [Hymenobacter cyanobacteriorum]MCI1187678.1 DinB family protein [Hymenobacter cyanobacteriorum]
MLLDTLRQLFARDLSRLHQEIEAYHDETQIWHIDKEIANSAGNLCLHLVGNLTTYISSTLGGVAYTRDRDGEFSLKGVPRAELIRQIETTREQVEQALSRLPADDLAAEYPLLVFDRKTSTEYFLVHLATHLAYHLGQINYHRRLLDGPGAA